ncbi:hypothetical protein [Rossellomorea aquimaris]|uniref:Lipoprotein n=1 Tax=Rossellomorea aquimaris TaxID=189382 RepID=A0A5D4TI05_9BACI|nr:hypothetical protein [Rossellomorea aquimaris]TYS75277.1 hypothetical protein FZC80_17725 [Rossellomorea aquimaris]
MNNKNVIILLTVFLVTLFLSACGSSSAQNDANSSNQENAAEEENAYGNESNNDADEVSTTNNDDTGSNENTSADSTESEALSGYSAEEIEYARVWLQIVGNPDIEVLNVVHISAGDQVNPYDDDSVNYPEDVISLGGKVVADGTVTYSGNGDGTINVYNLPSHWPSNKQIDTSMEEYTKDIITNTKQVYIEPRSDEEISTLIEKIKQKNKAHSNTQSGNEDSDIKTDTPEKDQKKAISLARDYLRNTYDDFVEDEDHFLAYDGEINGKVIVRYATLLSGHTSTNGRYAVDITNGEVKDFTADPQAID